RRHRAGRVDPPSPPAHRGDGRQPERGASGACSPVAPPGRGACSVIAPYDWSQDQTSEWTRPAVPQDGPWWLAAGVGACTGAAVASVMLAAVLAADTRWGWAAVLAAAGVVLAAGVTWLAFGADR